MFNKSKYVGDGKNDSSRRSFLKAGVATASTALAPSVVGATSQEDDPNSERADRIHDAALEIRDNTGSQERYKQFLSENADHFQSRQVSFTPDSVESDGPSSQNWSDKAISTELSISYYSDSCTYGEYYAYFDYYITVDSSYGYGEGGPDQNSISWADHHYRYEEGSAYSDDNMDNFDLYAESLNGVDWEWQDGRSCRMGCDTKEYYVGCKAEILETNQERAVQASYWDMWDDTEVCGVSFTSSGDVSFSFCTNGNSDQYGYEIEEDGDVNYECSP